MSVFPKDTEFINKSIENNIKQGKLPLFKEYAIDLKTGKLIYDDIGQCIILEGNEALKIWIWKVIQVTKNRYEIYENNYGNEFEKIIGNEYSKQLKDAEIERYLLECLTANPYIKNIKNINICFCDNKLSLNCTVTTVYGEVVINV